MFYWLQVNADIKKYEVDSNGVPRLTSVDTRSVGVDISTKSVGSTRREDVTSLVSQQPLVSSPSQVYLPHYLQYKHSEGSRMERRALYHGYEELLKQSQDVTFNIPEKKFSFGEDVRFEVEMTNKAKQHVVKGTILCEAVDYTGKVCSAVLVVVSMW